MKLQIFIIGCFCLFIVAEVNAQEYNDTTQVWRIITIDGNEFIGTIKKKEPTQIIVTSPIYGEIMLNQSAINKMELVQQKQLIKGELWTDNPQSSRYFWVPNGYGLKKGEGYYQNVWVLFNQASYGFSNYFSVGVGMLPLFLFGGEATPVWITPKFSFPIVKDKFNLGVGTIVGTVIGEDAGTAGLVYSVATIGNRNTNLNFGVGYGFVDDDWGSTPVFSFSAMARVSRSSYLLTENYLITTEGETVSLIMIGARTVWTKVSIDYGLVVPISDEMDQPVAIPWLGFVVPFGTY
ncbi:MAG: hypothetical protein WCX31_00060 [Salinivirgaceae bacterium]|jgi:hypothetical protein